MNKEIPSWVGLVSLFSYICCEQEDSQLGGGLCSCSAIYAMNKKIPNWVGLVFPFSYIYREQGDSQLGGACVPIQIYML